MTTYRGRDIFDFDIDWKDNPIEEIYEPFSLFRDLGLSTAQSFFTEPDLHYPPVYTEYCVS